MANREQPYHISKDGTPGVCRAKERPCPLGDHYETYAEAYYVSQGELQNEFGLMPVEAKMAVDLEDLKFSLSSSGDKSVASVDEIRTKISDLNREIKGSSEETQEVSEILKGVGVSDGGATFNMSGVVPTTGFCASPFPEHSKVFDSAEDVSPMSIAKYVDEIDKIAPGLFEEEETYIGLWNDPEDGQIYLDISKRYETAEEARDVCERRDQIAFFDLNTFESVDVDRSATSGQLPKLDD